jgi:heterodisulfide reductase subunit C2
MAMANAELRVLVTKATGQNVFRCYQCGNCSAGCPMAAKGDVLPHQVIRHLQLGDDEPLRMLQPWLCVGCQTCVTRCPQEFDLSLVMDALRAEAVRRGTAPASAKPAVVFNQVFLEQIMAGGRLSEVELGVVYNLRTMNPLSNATAVPGLMTRGKFRLFGKKVRGLKDAGRTGRTS